MRREGRPLHLSPGSRQVMEGWPRPGGGGGELRSLTLAAVPGILMRTIPAQLLPRPGPGLGNQPDPALSNSPLGLVQSCSKLKRLPTECRSAGAHGRAVSG